MENQKFLALEDRELLIPVLRSLTLQTVQQFGVADVLVCAVSEALVVPLSPGVHLPVFGQGHGELAPAAHLDDVQVLQLLHQFGRLAAVAASSAQLSIVSISPRPHLT